MALLHTMVYDRSATISRLFMQCADCACTPAVAQVGEERWMALPKNVRTAAKWAVSLVAGTYNISLK